MKKIPISELRLSLGELVLGANREPVNLTYRNKVVAVLVPIDMVDTFNKEAVKQDAGSHKSWRQVRNEAVLAETTLSPKEIAVKYSMSLNNVYNILKGSMTHHEKELKARNTEIHRDHVAGVTPAELAKKYGLHVNTVYGILSDSITLSEDVDQ